MFSKRIGSRAIWITLGICGTSAVLVKLGPLFAATLAGIVNGNEAPLPLALVSITEGINNNARTIDALLGLCVPLIVLITIELSTRRVDEGWLRMATAIQQCKEQTVVVTAATLPLQIVGWAMGVLGVALVILALTATEQRITLAIFAIMLLVIASGIGAVCWKNRTIRDIP